MRARQRRLLLLASLSLLHFTATAYADLDRLATASLAFNGLSTDSSDKDDVELSEDISDPLSDAGPRAQAPFADFDLWSRLVASEDAEDHAAGDGGGDVLSDVRTRSVVQTTTLSSDAGDAHVVAASAEAGPGLARSTETMPNSTDAAEQSAAAASHQHCPPQCACFDLTVDCANRELRRLPTRLPNWTQVLQLHDNLLEELPADLLATLPALRVLNVNNNGRLSLEPGVFSANRHLHTIDMSGCGLGEVPLLDLPPSVRIVNLSGNSIRQVSRAALTALRHLHELDLSHNRLTRLPAHPFVRDTQLRTLKLHSNRIRTLDWLQSLGRLHTLKLAKNRVGALKKDAFRGLTQLRELDLNRNRLTEIESLVFSGLDSLQVLKLKRNGIKGLGDGAFYHLPNMTQLFLDHNAIWNVTKGWLYGTRRLQQLSLSHNRLWLVDRDCWTYCEQLARLDLSHNLLTSVDAQTFARLPRLTQLLLNHNQIALIEENALQGSPKLRTLELNNNMISSAIEDRSGALAGLPQLTRLELRHNRIMSVGGQALAGAPSLQQLDLAGNALTTIQRAAFSGLTQLRVLVVDSAALLCDCALRWLPGWLAEAGHAATVTARCHHPARLHGRRLTEVPENQLTCQDSPKPGIRLHPRTGKTLKGDNLTLSCEAESSANHTMQFGWRKDSQPVEQGRAVPLAWAHADGRPGRVMRSELRLTNLTDADAGQYQCVVSNRFGVTYSEKATIAVHVFPVFTLRPEDVELRAGSTAKLECKALGQPPATIAWQKDGGSDFPAARERRMHMLQSEDVFFIVQVQPADQGTYTCTARNDAGEIRANATLSVLEPPSFVRPMEDREVVAGDTAVLDCMASGSPTPHLSWSKDGAPLEATERHFYTAGHQLLIIVQTTAADAGHYQCRLSNVLGEKRDHAQLTVLPVSSLGLDDDSTYAIIIIAVVSGVVVTSLVWVIIIYQARKRSLRQLRARAAAAAGGAAGSDRQLPAAPQAVAVYAAPLRDRRASSVQLYTAGDDGSEHSSGKDSGQGGHDELAGGEAGLPLVVAVAADSDDEGVGGTPLLERRPRVLTTFQSGGPSRAPAQSLQTVVPPHLYTDRRLAQLADGALVTARARQPTEV